MLHAALEIVALDEHFRADARIDAVGGLRAAEIVAEHVNLADAAHGHALHTARAPPAEGVCGAEETARLAVARAYQVGVLVHVRAVGVAERTPADGVEIGRVRDVEVAVHAVHEVAVVHPAVLRRTERQQVAATHVDRAGPLEPQVADDDVLAAEHVQHACVAVVLLRVARHVDNHLARLQLRLLAHAVTVRQRAARAAAGAHRWHSGLVQCVANLRRDAPLGAQPGPVDAHQRLAARGDVDAARHDEVARRTVQHHDVVLLDSLLDGHPHVLSVRLQHRHRAFEIGGYGVRIASATRHRVGAGSVRPRCAGTESEGLVQVVVGSRHRHRDGHQYQRCEYSHIYYWFGLQRYEKVFKPIRTLLFINTQTFTASPPRLIACGGAPPSERSSGRPWGIPGSARPDNRPIQRTSWPQPSAAPRCRAGRGADGRPSGSYGRS